MLNHLHVGLGPIAFAELPHIDDVAVENEPLGLNGFEVAKQLFGVTAVGAEVNVGNNHQLDIAFSFLAQPEKCLVVQRSLIKSYRELKRMLGECYGVQAESRKLKAFRF